MKQRKFISSLMIGIIAGVCIGVVTGDFLHWLLIGVVVGVVIHFLLRNISKRTNSIERDQN